MLSALTLRLRLRVLLALLTAVGVTYAATGPVGAFARRIGAMDRPGESRRVHDHPIPRLGGLAIFLGFLAGLLLFTSVTRPLRGILLGSAVIVVLGVADDIYDLNPWVKLLVQTIAAVIALLHGVEIRILTNPVHFAGGVISLGALSAPITLLWIVGMTNALNLIDGLDGLAAGVAGISCASMLAVSLFLPRATDVSVLLGALGGACLGFLPYNRNPARIFMGDTGALLLGYVLSTASVVGLLKMYTAVTFAMPLLALALPLFDTVFAVVRRLSHGENPMKADRGHIHHRLLAMGLNQKQAVAILYGFSVLLGLAAVLLAANGSVRFWLLLLAGTAVAAVWLWLFLRRHKTRTKEKTEDD